MREGKRMDDPAFVDITNLSVAFEQQHGSRVHAVRGVSVKLREGESLGIVGESGCGKTTLGSAILNMLPSSAEVTADRFRIAGTDIRPGVESDYAGLRWSGVSAIFQNAMTAFNPVERVGTQIVDAIRLHTDSSRAQARSKAEYLFETVGIDPRRLRAYPHQLSGGMRQRAMIALALSCDPQLVLADEPTTALDVIAQNQVLALLKKLRVDLGLTVVMISHDLGAISEVCDRVAVMYAGEIVEEGPMRGVLVDPQHPYTRALVGAYPRLRGPKSELVSIPGGPPELSDPSLRTRCSFSARCSFAVETCVSARPDLAWVAGSPPRAAACSNPAVVTFMEGAPHGASA